MEVTTTKWARNSAFSRCCPRPCHEKGAQEMTSRVGKEGATWLDHVGGKHVPREGNCGGMSNDICQGREQVELFNPGTAVLLKD